MVLVVQDDTTVADTAPRILEQTGSYRINRLPLHCDIVAEVGRRAAAVVVFDVWRISADALHAVSVLHAEVPHVQVVVVSVDAEANVRTARRRLPLADWLPRTHAHYLPASVAAALRVRSNRSRFLSYKHKLITRPSAPENPRTPVLVAESKQMQQLLHTLATLDDEPLLLCGEPGSGRTALARAAHRMHRGAAVMAELSAVDRNRDELLVAAVSAALRAAGGTVLLSSLDTLGEAGRRLPADLARALVPMDDPPVVMATASPGWRAAPDMVALEVPPLRRHREDLPALVAHFAARAAAELQQPPIRLSRRVEAALAAYAFPGNVAELRDLICAATADPDSLLPELGRRSPRTAFPGEATPES